MSARPSILCPVDFSDASRGSLRYAEAIARHFGADLTVVTVTDPLLMEAAAMSSAVEQLPDAVRKELHHFCEESFDQPEGPDSVRIEVVTGKPAVEILRLAHELGAAAIVMSTHGLTGMRKLFFGSTTERVLRETTVPVLLTPAHDRGPAQFDDIKRAVRRTLVPVDLTGATVDQVAAATTVAAALEVPVLLTYVVEPLRFAVSGLPHLATADAERRARAEKALAEFALTIPANLRPEALVAYGDPAEEIAKIARDRSAGLIVIGLHATSVLGPRMGSVTYRVLCLTSALVLALPPGMVATGSNDAVEQQADATATR